MLYHTYHKYLNWNCLDIYVKQMSVIKSGWFLEFCNG